MGVRLGLPLCCVLCCWLVAALAASLRSVSLVGGVPLRYLAVCCLCFAAVASCLCLGAAGRRSPSLLVPVFAPVTLSPVYPTSPHLVLTFSRFPLCVGFFATRSLLLGVYCGPLGVGVARCVAVWGAGALVAAFGALLLPVCFGRAVGAAVFYCRSSGWWLATARPRSTGFRVAVSCVCWLLFLSACSCSLAVCSLFFGLLGLVSVGAAGPATPACGGSPCVSPAGDTRGGGSDGLLLVARAGRASFPSASRVGSAVEPRGAGVGGAVLCVCRLLSVLARLRRRRLHGALLVHFVQRFRVCCRALGFGLAGFCGGLPGGSGCGLVSSASRRCAVPVPLVSRGAGASVVVGLCSGFTLRLS